MEVHWPAFLMMSGGADEKEFCGATNAKGMASDAWVVCFVPYFVAPLEEVMFGQVY